MFTFYWENKFLIGQIFLFFSVLNWFWGVEKQTNKYYILNIRDSKFQLWHITKSTLLLHRTLQSMTKTPMPKSYMHGFFWPSLKSKEELRFISYPDMLLHNRSSKLRCSLLKKVPNYTTHFSASFRFLTWVRKDISIGQLKKH